MLDKVKCSLSLINYCRQAVYAEINDAIVDRIAIMVVPCEREDSMLMYENCNLPFFLNFLPFLTIEAEILLVCSTFSRINLLRRFPCLCKSHRLEFIVYPQHFECKNEVISTFGKQTIKLWNLSLLISCRFWLFQPHFLINLFSYKKIVKLRIRYLKQTIFVL